ncbi:hypothetical protein M885DRAFT_551871 [Pelagophyceae sp. CCMP2097]|nr:hypothetical protein M885DRAFT_551871 [Pelagophyceae sp. CCMP2097]
MDTTSATGAASSRPRMPQLRALLCGLALATCAALAPPPPAPRRGAVRARAQPGPAAAPAGAAAAVSDAAVAQLKAELRREIAASGDDLARVADVCARLAAARPAADVEAALEGDWLTLTSTVLISQRQTVPLKFLTFGALSMTPVTVDAWYNRVDRGTYTLVPCVRVADGEALVGVALAGPCAFKDAARPGVCSVRFESARLVPVAGAEGAASAESLAACAALGGIEAAAAENGRIPLATPLDTTIEVTFIDDELRVHVGNSGQLYILERVSGPLPVLF